MSTAQQLADLSNRLQDTEVKVAQLLALLPGAAAPLRFNAVGAAAYLGMGLKNFNRLVRLAIIRPEPGKKRQRTYLRATLDAYRVRKLGRA